MANGVPAPNLGRTATSIIAALATAWMVAIIAQHRAPPLSMDDVISVAVATLPPAIVLVFALGTLTSRSRTVTDTLFTRIDRASEDVAGLESGIDRAADKLASTLDQIAAITRLSDETVPRLLVGTSELTGAANAMVASGNAVADVTQRFTQLTPEAARLNADLVAVHDLLDSQTAEKLKLLGALLAAVQVRGDEVAIQADVAIASLNKQLAEVDEQSRQVTGRIAKRAYALDAAVDGASGRAAALLDSVGDTIAAKIAAMDEQLAATRTALTAVVEHGDAIVDRQLDRLSGSGERLATMFDVFGERTAAVRAAADAHLDGLPDRFERARHAGEATFDELIRGADGIAAKFADLHQPFDASTAAIAGLHVDMTRLNDIAASFTSTLADGIPEARVGIEALATRNTALAGDVAGLSGKLELAMVGTAALHRDVTSTRRELAALGDDDLRRVDDRMNATATVMRDIGRELTTYAVQSEATRTAVEVDITALTRHIAAAASAGDDRLATLTGHVAGLHGALEQLGEPLDRARDGLAAADAQTMRLDEAATLLGSNLAHVIAVTSENFEHMHARAAHLLGTSAEVQGSARDGADAIDRVAARFVAERDALDTAVAALGGALTGASDTLAALEVATRRVDTDTAVRLGETFVRVRQLSDEHAVALDDLLQGVVRATATALEQTGGDVAEAAFATPIRRELAAVGEMVEQVRALGDSMTQRIAGQVRTVDAQVLDVDARIAEMETRLDVRARDTLTARSARLLAMLGTASVDVSKLLAIDAGDGAWVEYLKGDRSVFARRAVRLVDGAMATKIARHFAHDDAFRDEASHYLGIFEQLSRRLMTDPDGDALLATVVSSDLGKLYVALARGTGRWSPIG